MVSPGSVVVEGARFGLLNVGRGIAGALLRLGPGFRPFVDQRQQQQRQQGRGDQSADHDRGQRPLRFGADAAGQQHRHQAEDRDRRRSSAPAAAAARRLRAPRRGRDRPCSRRSFRKLTSTMPFNIATPNTAMKPIADGTDRYCPVMNSPTMPPMIANGTLAMISVACAHRVERGVQQDEDQADGQRHDHRQPRHRALLVLEGAAPFDPVAGRQLSPWRAMAAFGLLARSRRRRGPARPSAAPRSAAAASRRTKE